MGDDNPETPVRVDVVRVVPVAVGTADILAIIIERPAAQDASRLDRPFTTGLTTRK